MSTMALKQKQYGDVAELLRDVHDIVKIGDNGVDVRDAPAFRDRIVDRLVYSSVFGSEDVQTASRWLIRSAANALGALTASINDLYMAAGQNAYNNVTTPAINLRTMTYDLGRTVFRAAKATDSRQVILELARSETGYTSQPPAEYATSVLAAAIREEWHGPVFIQGDHYQASASKFAKNPAQEIDAVRKLSQEAIAAGYGNIDIDSSTLVDLSQQTLAEQQRNNYERTAELTQAIREVEPEGVTISIGGEIGEVGKANSTVEDLVAFMDGYQAELARRSEQAGRDLVGISKISVQTGTSHGGVMLPDGTIKQVSVDFDTLRELTIAARERYGMGGAVQHGASTLPEEAFSHFSEANAVEVHLATAFQNIIMDSEHFPADLRKDIHAWLDANAADERKPDQNDEQFYYSTRKKALGAFKEQFWMLPDDARHAIMEEALRPKFELIFNELNIAGNGHLVEQFVKPARIDTDAPAVLR